jgi:hypothetical protein
MEKIDIGTEINLTDLLISRLLIQANSGGGKSVLARKIIEQAYGKVPFIVMDCDGEYYTLKEKLDDVIIIGGQAADIAISMQSVKLLPREIIGNRLSVVIDLSEMKMTDRIRYVKIFLETMMELPKTFWVPYLVFLEEVHKFCGEQDKQESGPAVRDLMSRGRKMGYCGILITQRISKLHKDAAAEVNNKFVGRTNLDIDMDRAAKELGFTASSTYTRLSLRDLAPGHFYAYGTSIQPHHVHEVTIKMPETRIPKAGSIIDIKPKKPTEKLLAALNKLSQLPKSAEKEAQDIKGLQADVARLKTELARASKAMPAAAVPIQKSAQALQVSIDKAVKAAKDELTKHYNSLMKDKDDVIRVARAYAQQLEASLVKIHQLSDSAKFPSRQVDHRIMVPDVIPNVQRIAKTDKKSIPTVKNIPKIGNSEAGESLGKCAKAILTFLVSLDRPFTKVQAAIATGYSVTSGGFNNSLSELTSRGLIIRGQRLTHNREAIYQINLLLGDIPTADSSLETFKANLGKCELEIYEVLLDCPHDKFNKESLADKTPSQYSPTSGGFNNSLSRLTTLELITRERGEIRLNPELLELL